MVFHVSGARAAHAFRNEPGGHRWQRVPPTEKRGRVHTSTVTVAVLDEPSESEIRIDPRDVDEKFVRGSGSGGQHRNTADTCVMLTHRPSGVAIRVDGGRSQWFNRQTAMGLLRARLKQARDRQGRTDRNAQRRAQVGSGQRGDKRRTISLQRDQVVDHVTGRRISAKRYLRGEIDALR